MLHISGKCEFYTDCELYTRTSKVCMSGGGDYCGKYKERKYGRVQKTLIHGVEFEDLKHKIAKEMPKNGNRLQ